MTTNNTIYPAKGVGTTNDKLTSALKYAERGYYVLPAKGKRPLIKFADQPPLNAEQINEYWRLWPDANIALRTVDFLVVDIDTKQAHGANGLASAKQLTKDGLLTRTLEQVTASNGRQLFYSKPPDTEVKQVIGLKPGIDIKAHPNNYVVVPPSNTSKGQYHWIDETAQMQQPPAGLIDLINSYHPQNHVVPTYHQRPSGKLWTGTVLDNVIKGAPQGQRNMFLTRLCGQMVHAKAEPETVVTLLHYANEFNEPPLSANEVDRIIESVLREELKR